MTRVLCDSVLREKLHGLAQPIELVDEAGHVLARVVPAIEPELGPLEPRISKEERKRRRSQGGKTYTTAEVLAYLQSI
jgi:hypothetical protein